ncbi:ABC transporter ATP-binding protein [Candidatus Cryosericum odellii]|jgi:ATP-binding cassette subfamily B protein|uniref:ABC transporter ATP-binding protein n=1 Tax=Candidatus Cryosericum odellii TaxID=2290917 RepID=A0A398CW57_9BACT|nr:ABC transporter ATP-binding protein [Candidatus Cryosericum odellii]RIE06885.1 ABC transporter ATP-binding protein [Candidatus Cryosericum odellii]RIE07625.1 ABC transporter ATP-binding protein [Candidatus Cryosericum odellii]
MAEQNRPIIPMRGGGRSMAFQKPKNVGATTRRILAYFGRSKYALIVVCIMLIISTGSALAGSYFLKPMVNNYIMPGNFKGLAVALVVLAAIYLVGVIASYFQGRVMVTIGQKTANLMRKDLFEKLQELPLKFFDTHTHGELMSRFTNDMDNVEIAIEQSAISLISSILVFVGTLVMMLILSPILFAVAAVILAFMILLSVILSKKSTVYFRMQQSSLGTLDGYIEEMVDGLKVVKVFGHEQVASSEFSGINDKYRSSATTATFLSGLVMAIMGNLGRILYATVAIVGGVLAIAGHLDIGSLVAFLQYSYQIAQPINQATNQLSVVLAALAGAERIFEVMDQQVEVNDGTVTLVNVTYAEDGTEDGTVVKAPEGTKTNEWAWSVPGDNGHTLVPLKGDVRFDRVTFSYDGVTPVLKNISLYAKPGETIAFVGSTGAGKTTITNLINRFYDVQEGTITYDGIDVKTIRKGDLRHSLGMVLQDTHLFTGSVMYNIRYGRLDATDDECRLAAKRASADSFIRRLPQGYDTIITGDGSNLSQGERQLLAITRAYVADPPVMILDEATSSIDTRTERLIEQGMDALMENRTVFVIAHRLSTVRHAKAIIVLEHGEIVERGNHDSLVAEKGRYFQLYTGQSALE